MSLFVFPLKDSLKHFLRDWPMDFYIKRREKSYEKVSRTLRHCTKDEVFH